MASSQPAAQLSFLPKADGSASFTYSGYTVTAAVNGPIEAQRRDEQAFEALVDVNVRPAAGVGGTAERQLEAILQSCLRQLIPVREYPRCMIQITLQIVETPENLYENAKVVQAQMSLLSIPALVHAAVLGLLTAAVPMKCYATSAVLAIPEQGEVIIDPTPAQAGDAKSLHAFGFNSDDDLLLMESEGAFSTEEMSQIIATAEKVCCQRTDASLDTAMEDGDSGSGNSNIRSFIRSVMETKAARDLHWK